MFAGLYAIDELILGHANRAGQVFHSMLSASSVLQLSQHYLHLQDFEKSLPVNHISE